MAAVGQGLVGDAGAGLVTVVVPAYNIERYVGECLESLLTQSAVADLSVIVVDDGSTDGTAAVVEAVGAHEPRVRLVRQTNQGPGPGAARNHGLDLVTTEFVMFCDGDDQLTPRAVEQLRDGLVRSGLDFAIGASEQFPTPRSWLWTPYFVPGTTTEPSIEDVPLLAHNASPSNKMFRTAALRASGRRFAEGIHHQDTVVTVPTMVTSERIVLVGDVVHRYRKRPEGGSIMDSHYTRLDNFWDHLQVIETLGAQLDGLPPGRRPLQEAFIARSFQGFSWRAPDVLPAERLTEFFERSRAVVSTLSEEVIVAATRDAAERAGYVAMLEDDLTTYRALGRRMVELRAHRGDLYLDLPTSSARRHKMLATGVTRALVGGLAADDEQVQLTLSVQVRGARDLGRGLNGVVLRMLDGQDGREPLASYELRLTADEEAGHRSEARLSIPRAGLATGRYRLRLGFRTPGGESARWVRRPRLALEGAAGADEPEFVPDEVVTTADGFVALSHHEGVAVLEVA